MLIMVLNRLLHYYIAFSAMTQIIQWTESALVREIRTLLYTQLEH